MSRPASYLTVPLGAVSSIPLSHARYHTLGCLSKSSIETSLASSPTRRYACQLGPRRRDRHRPPTVPGSANHPGRCTAGSRPNAALLRLAQNLTLCCPAFSNELGGVCNKSWVALLRTTAVEVVAGGTCMPDLSSPLSTNARPEPAPFDPEGVSAVRFMCLCIYQPGVWVLPVPDEHTS